MYAWSASGWKRDEGQTLIEYSLIFALVAIGLVTVLLLFRDSLGNSYQTVGGRVDRARVPGVAPGGSSSGEDPAGGLEGAGGGAAGGGGTGYGKPGGSGKGKDKGHHGCGGGRGGGSGRGGGCGGGGNP